MQHRMRLYATMVIWAAFTIMTVVMTSSVTTKASSTFEDIIPLMGIVGGAAIIGTFSVWISALGNNQPTTTAVTHSQTRAEQTKRKRMERARLERLINQMDADALDELEDLLIDRNADPEFQRGGHGQ